MEKMSVKAMAWVWDQDISRDEKFVLLAYADHADHEGNNIFPAVSSIAQKTGYSKRSIQKITKTLIDHKLLIPDGKSYLQTNKYSIPIWGGEETAPPIYRGEENDIKGVQNLRGGVKKTTGGGELATAPEPSLNHHIKPLKETTTSDFALLVREYEQNIGVITKITNELLSDDFEQYGYELCSSAIKEAVRQNKRTWAYVQGILKKRWANGYRPELQNNGKKTEYKEIWQDGQLIFIPIDEVVNES